MTLPSAMKALLKLLSKQHLIGNSGIDPGLIMLMNFCELFWPINLHHGDYACYSQKSITISRAIIRIQD